MGDEVPASNPWANAASSAPPPPPPGSCDAVGDPEAAPVPSAPPASATASAATSKLPAAAAAAAGTAAAPALPAVAAVAVVVPPAPGCRRACLRCCSGTHGVVAGSWPVTMSFLGLLCALLLADFIYSLVLLAPTGSVGACGASACAAPVLSPACASLGGGAGSCSAACDAAAAAGVAPLRFTSSNYNLSNAGEASAYVYCPFPKLNTYWRVPLAILSSLVAALALLAMIRRWRDAVIAACVLLFAAGGLYFYVMIIDSNSTHNTQAACDGGLRVLGFAAAAGAAGAPACALGPFIAISVVDAALALLCLYAAAVLYTNCKRIRTENVEEAGKAASRAANAAATRAMFSGGEAAADEPPPSGRPAFN